MGKLKASKQIKAEVDLALYYPGGIDGGGSARSSRGKTGVVRPHTRTSTSCTKCGQFHTLAEHERHGRTNPRTIRPKAARTTRPKAATRTRPKATTQSNSDANTELGTAVARTVRDAPASSRFGPRKVWISKIWPHVRKATSMSLDAWKQWLIREHQAGRLVLARADLVQAMDPKLVAASSTIPTGERYPEFHFLVDDTVDQKTGTGHIRREVDLALARPSADHAPISDVELARIVKKRIEGIPLHARFSPDKVWIVDLWNAVRMDPRVTGAVPDLHAFQRRLIALQREGHLFLARADSQGDMDADKLVQSEIADLGARYHFVLDPVRMGRPWG